MVEPPKTSISRSELVAILAMLTATVAFSIDAMLPVLPDISASLAPDAPNQAQLVIATFVVGMGLGTLFAGPLSDTYGRHKIAICGAALYIAGALLGAIAPNLETMLIARALQGVGAAGPRVVAVAITRDLFSGRQMARIVSFVMIVFTLVPVIAPSLGAAIAWAFGWRTIFYSFALFSVLSVGWLILRQPETLHPDNHRPFRAKELWQGIREVFSNKQVTYAIFAQTLIYSMLFVALMSSQQIFDQGFGLGTSYPLWFGLCAAISATASLLNATIVVRIGMQKVVAWSLAIQIAISLAFVVTLTLLNLPYHIAFTAFFIWLVSVFYMAGLGIGNLNAVAMEPMGHMAGLAASIISATATVASVLVAAPISLSFDGTPLPIALGVLGAGILSLTFVSRINNADIADEASKP
ncbi:MAG: multidrug effflux MFS transporter [Boseongicola sp.]|nr:multidrug effflux MFS transporter [Boseongicola sp.]